MTNAPGCHLMGLKHVEQKQCHFPRSIFQEGGGLLVNVGDIAYFTVDIANYANQRRIHRRQFELSEIMGLVKSHEELVLKFEMVLQLQVAKFIGPVKKRNFMRCPKGSKDRANPGKDRNRCAENNVVPQAHYRLVTLFALGCHDYSSHKS